LAKLEGAGACPQTCQAKGSQPAERLSRLSRQSRRHDS
jgi:hypothetical protein